MESVLNEKSQEDVGPSASKALKLVANAADEAIKAVVNVASEAVKANARGGNDHDLLIKIATRMEGLKEDILDLKNDTSANIKDLKNGTSANIENHEKRLSSLEKAKGNQTLLISIGTGILLVLASMLIYHLFQQPIPKVL